MNIPAFPEFKKINIFTREEVEVYTKSMASYSDFNYVSLYTYGLGSTRLSILNSNLVLLGEDYMDEQFYFSFIGKNKINETVATLLKEAEKRNITQELRLIPEAMISEISDKYSISEDSDNHDFLLSAEKLLKYEGRQLRNKRNLLNRFKKHYIKVEVKLMDCSNLDIQQQALVLFDVWNSNKNGLRTDLEKAAIMNLLNIRCLNCHYIGIYVKGELISFLVYEILHDCCMLHFVKFDVAYEGICAFTYQVLADNAIKNGCNIINVQQDLGIEGLRNAKKQYCPVGYLKKYTVKIFD